MHRWQDMSDALMQPGRQLSAWLIIAIPTFAPIMIDWAGKLAALIAAILLVVIQRRTAAIKKLELRQREIELKMMEEKIEAGE